jgi:argininosuccinate lyase
MAFAPEYIACVLGENFEDAKRFFVEPLFQVHRAHLVMLAEQGIIERHQAAALARALRSVEADDLGPVAFDSTFEDLFYYVNGKLVQAVGPELAGRLHTARSRNDIDMTMYRMRQREWLIDVLAAVIDLRRVLLEIADRQGNLLIVAHTHGQPAQPTTVAHYLLAVIEQLERDTGRLLAAFATTNRSPLGACAITGTGFPIDRRLTGDLLGFAGTSGNTYGSIASIDYLLEGVNAVSVAMVGLGRVLQEWLAWAGAELGWLKLGPGFVQGSSIMPQKRNPVALEHARGLASKAAGQAYAVALVTHNTPFGDVVDTEDDLQPLVFSVYHDATRALRLVAAAMASAELRAADPDAARGATSTELADALVRDHHLDFSTAHAIVARFVQESAASRGSLSGLLARVSEQVTGRALLYPDQRLEEITSARHFVDIRLTEGGPAAGETGRSSELSRQRLDVDASSVQALRDRLASARERLQQRTEQL